MEDKKTVLIACKQRRVAKPEDKDHKPVYGSRIPVLGLTLHFKPTEEDKSNPDADHVCAVPFERADVIYRLLAIKEGFHLVDPDAELPPRPSKKPDEVVAIGNQAPASKKPIMISNGEEQIDLNELSFEALQVLARDTFKLKVHHKWTEQVIIQRIMERVRGED